MTPPQVPETPGTPVIAGLIEVIGWVGFALGAIAAAFLALSGSFAGAAASFSAAITGLLLIGVGVIIDRVHKIEIHLRK